MPLLFHFFRLETQVRITQMTRSLCYSTQSCQLQLYLIIF